LGDVVSLKDGDYSPADLLIIEPEDEIEMEVELGFYSASFKLLSTNINPLQSIPGTILMMTHTSVIVDADFDSARGRGG